MIPAIVSLDLGTVLLLGVLIHGVGDFVLQSGWMAARKPKSWRVAALHVAIYTPLFLLVSLSPLALGTIAATHLVIDRFCVAKHVIRVRNHVLTPRRHRPRWASTADTGFAPGTIHAVTAAMLVTIVDQILHVGINSLALSLL